MTKSSEHSAERYMRQATIAEARLLSQAAAAAQASRDRRRRARESRKAAHAALDQELGRPLVESPQRIRT